MELWQARRPTADRSFLVPLLCGALLLGLWIETHDYDYAPPPFVARGQQGIGYDASWHAHSPWLAPLAEAGPQTTIYSNDPFLLVARTGRPVKSVSLRRERNEIEAFMARVEATSPAVLGLFADGQPMYVRTEELLPALSGRQGLRYGEAYLFAFP